MGDYAKPLNTPYRSSNKLRRDNCLSEITGNATLLATTLANLGLTDAGGNKIAVSSPTAGGIGYSTGAGGTGTQGTSKSTTVTLSPAAVYSGSVTTHNAALNAGVVVSFDVTNTSVAATDVIVANHISGGTLGSYTVNARAGAGKFTIDLRNNTAGNLSEALVIQFAVMKAVTA